MPLRPLIPVRARAAVLLSVIASTALLIAGGLLVPSSARAADDDVTWTVRTASNDRGAERTNYTYTVNPGGTIDDELVVANRGTETLDLGVYAADGFTTDGGQFDVVTGDATSTGLGAWVRTKTDHITVKPGKTVTVPFTLRVPENATPGDYAGGIVTSLTQADDTVGVNVDRRLGIRMNLRVGGDLAPALAVEDVHVSWNGGLNPFAGGDAEVSYTLHNTGNTVLSAHDVVTVAGPLGMLPSDSGAVDAAPDLLPGESWTQHVTVAGVAPLVLLTGTASVTPTVTDAAGTTNDLAPVSAATVGWAVPWTLLALLLLAVAAVIVLPRLARRRRAVAQSREDARVKEAVAQALAAAE